MSERALPPAEKKARAEARAKAKADEIAEIKRRFLEIYRVKAGNIAAIIKELGISRERYRAFVADDERFRDAVRDEKEALNDFAETKLFEQINNGNIAAIIFYLKTQARHRGYVEKVEAGEVEVKVKLERVITDKRPKTNGENDSTSEV